MICSTSSPDDPCWFGAVTIGAETLLKIKMVETIIKPRISETTAGGHIGNTVVPIWFEEGRNEFLRQALPHSKFSYLLARIEQNFRREIFWGTDVFIKTVINRIGNSSIAFVQEIWQNQALCADGKSVIVHTNRETNRPAVISKEVRAALLEHGVEEGVT